MSSSLHTLLDHAERERDAMLATVGQAEQQLQQLRVQAQQLLSFRDDYRRRDPTAGGRSASIGALRAHQDFMQRLQQAMDQQQLQETTAQTRLAQLQRALLPLELRVASVRKLLDRRDLAARSAVERRDQRQSDESALQRHGRGHPNAIPSAL
jgi:flagellar FliJ protein